MSVKQAPYKVSTFYKFYQNSSEDITSIDQLLQKKADELKIKGLLILGPEGMNSTFSGSEESVQSFKQILRSITGYNDLVFKDSFSMRCPFRIFKIHHRQEIVTIGDPQILPEDNDKWSLSPKEWHEVLSSEEDIYLMDTRNWYETDMGSFKNAMIPNIEEFNEFPEWVEKQNLDKNKKVLMFCTGGIRCEKAQVALRRQGFKEVYQLENGILKYLEEFPEQHFDGECFVFDHRVAVDQNLSPSSVFDLCPHCGQPAKDELECKKCSSTAKVCHKCLEKDVSLHTCSKNCAHHYRIAPDKKGRKQITPLDRLRQTT